MKVRLMLCMNVWMHVKVSFVCRDMNYDYACELHSLLLNE